MSQYAIVFALLCLTLASTAQASHKRGPHGWVSHVSENVMSLLRSFAEQQAFVKRAAPPISGAPPKIPQKWVASINTTIVVNGTPMSQQLPFPTTTLPEMVVDSGKKRMAYLYHFKFAYAPAEYVGTPSEWFNSTTFITSNMTGMMNNNNKYLSDPQTMGGYFHDPFAWVPYVQAAGTAIFKGRSLKRWVFQSPQMKAELLTDARDMPVLSSTTTAQFTNIMELINFAADTEIPGLWEDFNEKSFGNPLVCPAPTTASPVKTTMYVFHPKNQFNISGQDLGDSTGDVFFTCTDVIDGQSPLLDHNYAWLTQWEVELFPQWGQYQNCNGYNPAKCVGLNNFWVGRESSNYIGSTNPVERQCGPTNALVGAWWSLPQGGRCGPGQHPGDGSCTWRERRVKTIDGKCLFSGNAYKAACEKDGRGPFPAATVLFLEAFASEDPSQGGCPELVPVQPRACSWNPGCVGLSGDCCPTSDGTMLHCCGVATANSSTAVIV